MSEYSGESSRFGCENWIGYKDLVLRVNGLEGETVAQVYLITDESTKRKAVVRLIAAAPEMYTLLARAVGIVERFNQSHYGGCQKLEFPIQEIECLLRQIDKGY